MKYRFHTKPYKHQVKAFKKIFPLLVQTGSGGLLMPMRSGKTKVAIDLCCALSLIGRCDRVLVIAPLAAIGVWRRQIALHKPEWAHITWVLVNYERTYARWYNDPEMPRSWEPIPNARLHRFVEGGKTVVISDESHKIGDPSAEQSKRVWKLGRGASARLIMTGTAVHRKPLMIFGQFKFLDEGVFGTRWTHFKKQYALWGGYGNRQLLRYRNLKVMWGKIQPNVFYLKHLPYRPPVRQIVPFQLGESQQLYNDMAFESYLEINGRVATADIVLTRLLRLRQIAIGWVKDEEGEWVRVGTEAQDHFERWLRDAKENGLNKLVVGAFFKPAVRDVAIVCKRAGYDVLLLHGGLGEGEADRRIVEFEEAEEPTVFVSQVSTGALGIDLSTSQDLYWYELPPSAVDFDQFEARIRKYRDKRALTYFYQMGEGTIQEVNYMAMRANIDLVDLVLREPDLIQPG